MAAPPTTRRLGVDDAQALMQLRREALENEPLAFGSDVDDDRANSESFVRAMLSDEEGQAVFGCFDADDLTGMLGVLRLPKAKQRHRAGIWGMYVSPRARNSGAGRALLEAAIGHARDWGLDQVQLSVTDAAPVAKRLYEAAGFRCWGCEPRSLQWEGRFVDEHHFVLDLRGFARL
jgi:GNAT superfamily N-acetyltransferase